MYKIIDNFLEQEYFDNLKLLLSSNEFPGFYQENISIVEDNHNNFEFQNFGFSHVFFKDGQINSTLFTKIEPILQFLSVET
jgi:hypothetical protein